MYINRGNTEAFINIFIGRWDNSITSFEEDDFGRHIVLEPDEFLTTDILKR